MWLLCVQFAIFTFCTRRKVVFFRGGAVASETRVAAARLLLPLPVSTRVYLIDV
jgi:hypothetical protein